MQDEDDEGYYLAQDTIPEIDYVLALVDMLGNVDVDDLEDVEDGEEDIEEGDLPPCMHDMSDDEAMMMEGDLARVVMVPDTPLVVSMGDIFSGMTADPLSQWYVFTLCNAPASSTPHIPVYLLHMIGSHIAALCSWHLSQYLPGPVFHRT